MFPKHRSFISSLFLCLLLTFLAGCASVAIKDNLPPSSPKGYADFANYTLGYDVIYSLNDGKKVRVGSLGYKGETLRVAKVPGNYDFIIEHTSDSGRKIVKLENVKIEQDKLTFITIDSRIVDIQEGTNEREPFTDVRYKLNVSQSKTGAPLHFESEAAKKIILHDLVNDPDWRARLYAVSSFEKMKSLDEEAIKTLNTMAIDDPHRSVREKAGELLRGLGIDPFEKVLFLDNFEANNKRRWISSGGRYTYFYNDEFLFSSTTTSGNCENEMMTSPLDLPAAFDVEVTGTWKTGSNGDAYGFLIGSDRDNFDHFAISGDGRALVRSIRNDEPSGDLIGWTTVDGVDLHGPNRLRLEVRGNVWKYYVNGTYVGTVENKLELENGYTFGLRVCQGQTISFDQFKISRVPGADPAMVH